jgi:hypothetical protein
MMSEIVLNLGVGWTAAGAGLMPVFFLTDHQTEFAAIMLSLAVTRLVSVCVLLVFGS